LPESLPPGWSNPNSIVLSGETAGQIVIPSESNFKTITGINPGTYPTVPQTTMYRLDAQNLAEISPVTSVLLHCSVVSNGIWHRFSQAIYNFVPQVLFTRQITITPPYPIWNNVVDGRYREIYIFFTDQNGNNLPMNDTDVTVTLIATDKPRD
jgi:hypothetical protein